MSTLINICRHYKLSPSSQCYSYAPHLVMVSYFCFFAISLYFYGANANVIHYYYYYYYYYYVLGCIDCWQLIRQ